MKVVYSDSFRKSFYKLPPKIKNIFLKQEEIFLKNWQDSRLHVKKLKGYPVAFSFRITNKYRTLFVFTDSQTILFAEIGHRKDIYK